MTSVSIAMTDVLARDADGPEFGKASPLGLLLVLLLLVGTVFLIRSMNKHLRKLPTSFMRGEPEADQAADDGTDAAGLVDDPPTTDGGDQTDATSAKRPHPSDGPDSSGRPG